MLFFVVFLIEWHSELLLSPLRGCYTALVVALSSFCYFWCDKVLAAEGTWWRLACDEAKDCGCKLYCIITAGTCTEDVIDGCWLTSTV